MDKVKLRRQDCAAWEILVFQFITMVSVDVSDNEMALLGRKLLLS
uniref:Uncharacterized protein n=1 Tax=Manihot esculenta TaxID=3983 RepID=A0A2C9VYD8_MANES